MAGWFEAFANFARAGQGELDRYSQLRMMDEDNMWKRRMQEAEMQNMSMQRQMNQRQLEALDDATLDRKRDRFLSMYGPGQRMSEGAIEAGAGLGFGDLMQKRGTMDLQQQQGNSFQLMPGVNVAGKSFTPEFSEQTFFQGTQPQIREQDQWNRQQRLDTLQFDNASRQRSLMDSQIADAETRRQAQEQAQLNQKAFQDALAKNPNMSPQQMIKLATQYQQDASGPQAMLSAITQQNIAGMVNARNSETAEARIEAARLAAEARLKSQVIQQTRMYLTARQQQLASMFQAASGSIRDNIMEELKQIQQQISAIDGASLNPLTQAIGGQLGPNWNQLGIPNLNINTNIKR